mmetsp:Transcript_3482/g.10757  ORF Transcript_3482/g.10757 Transcript_3482/m.10757 type:complete len:363 (-) Transcript_3482:196-1284(-)
MRVAGLAALAVAASACRRELRGKVHAFYYLWYDTPQFNGEYTHWNHAVLPHWDPRVRERYAATENTSFSPPETIHSVFYPARGPYSSRDPALLASHVEAMKRAGVDCVVLSWTGRGRRVSDTQGVSTDEVFPVVLDALAASGIGAAIHLEPYEGRSPETVRDDLAYLLDRYGDGLLRACGRPVVYVYDAYHSPDWSPVFCPDGARTVRGTAHDVVAIATFLDTNDRALATRSCFDGVYTYFATDGFTYGSTRRNWPHLVQWARAEDKLVSLSVGPGYDDTKIRPWNAVAARDRRAGDYFRDALRDAMAAHPDIISVTSFNEWGEGTQIEEAAPTPGYLDYGPNPALYLDILARATRTFRDDL